MTVVAVARRRSALEVTGPIVVRAGVALGYAVAVLTGGALGLWLLISLGEPATSG